MDKQLTDEQIIEAFKAAGIEFMTVYNPNENADVCLTVGSQKASKIIAAARALLSQQVEAANAAQWVSVKDRLPDCTIECTSSWTEVSKTVQLFGKCVDGHNGQGFGHLQDDGKWICYGGEYDFMDVVEVTHWKRLSTPDSALSSPAEQKEGNV